MQGMMFGINVFTKQSGIKLNAAKRKTSQIQQLSFRKYTSWLLFMISVLMTVLLISTDYYPRRTRKCSTYACITVRLLTNRPYRNSNLCFQSRSERLPNQCYQLKMIPLLVLLISTTISTGKLGSFMRIKMIPLFRREKIRCWLDHQLRQSNWIYRPICSVATHIGYRFLLLILI